MAPVAPGTVVRFRRFLPETLFEARGRIRKPAGSVEVTKAAAVQVVAHCFGASTFTMSMLGGYAGNVRSVVFSQISAHADVPFLTELKGGLHVPDLLERLGVTSLTAYAGEQTGWA